MAITSLKPIKAKNKRTVVDGRMYGPSGHVGFTDSEARGIFGSCYVPTDEEAERIRRYEQRKRDRDGKRGEYHEFDQRSKREQDEIAGRPPEKPKPSRTGTLEENREALGKLGIEVVGYRCGDGTVTRFDG